MKNNEISNEGSVIFAFELGKSECIKHNSDVNKCNNPYDKLSKEWKAWNRGWNDDFYKYGKDLSWEATYDRDDLEGLLEIELQKRVDAEQ